MAGMSTTTIRVWPETRDKLNRLAREDHLSAPAFVDRLIAREEDERLIASTNEAFAALRRDSEGWAAYQAEMAFWDAAAAPVPE